MSWGAHISNFRRASITKLSPVIYLFVPTLGGGRLVAYIGPRIEMQVYDTVYAQWSALSRETQSSETFVSNEHMYAYECGSW